VLGLTREHVEFEHAAIQERLRHELMHAAAGPHSPHSPEVLIKNFASGPSNNRLASSRATPN
jgi:hypothetical protein